MKAKIKYTTKNLLKPEDLKWILVDFDKTICSDSGNSDFIPGEPMPYVAEALTQLRSLGYKIKIFTARSWSDVIVVETYCRDFGIPFDSVIAGKPLGVIMIDDKGFHLKNWKKDFKKILKRLEQHS